VKEGLPLAVVYRKATNPLSDREFQAVRASYGAEWIDADDPIKMVKALREGKVLGLMTDLDTPGSGVVADYLGLKAMCPPGPARLALRYGCPIIPCIFVRDGEASATVHFEPRLEPTDSDNGESALVRLTKRINTTFEPWVLEYAEQYNWLHPRWRYRPDGRTWQHTDPIESQWAERVSPFPQLSERVRRIIHSKP
jgi:KDO2-lipid IV(A) lauroyltransferase